MAKKANHLIIMLKFIDASFNVLFFFLQHTKGGGVIMDH